MFIVAIGAVGALLLMFANRLSDRHRSRILNKLVATPIGMLGVFLLSIAAIFIGATVILPYFVAALTMLF